MLESMCAYQHVTRLHDSFWVADTLYICTDLCAGGTLADRIEADGPMTKGTAARFLKTLADFANDCLYEGTLMCIQIVLAHPRSVPDAFGIVAGSKLFSASLSASFTT